MAVKQDIGDGTWTAHQSNNTDVRFNLDQTQDGRLTGNADAIPLGGGAPFSGTLDKESLMRGTRVQIIVNWSTGSRGKYIGDFDFNGRLSGNGFDLKNPQSQALWFSEDTFKNPKP